MLAMADQAALHAYGGWLRMPCPESRELNAGGSNARKYAVLIGGQLQTARSAFEMCANHSMSRQSETKSR